MNAAAHTPGPWRVSANGNVVRIGDATENILICKFSNPTNANRRANATLIAAAPDLLRSLKDMLGDMPFALTKDGWSCDHCGREYSGHESKPTNCMDDCPGEMARQAIALAEGRAA